VSTSEYLLEQSGNLAIPASAPASDVIQYYGQFGDYIGGVWGTIIGIASLAIIVWTAYSTHRTNVKTKKYQIFSEILRSHEEIVSSLSIGNIKGREAFRIILAEFDSIYEEVFSANLRCGGALDLVGRIDAAFVFTYFGAKPDTVNMLGARYHMLDSDSVMRALNKRRRRSKESRIQSELRDYLKVSADMREEWAGKIDLSIAIIKSSSLPSPDTAQIMRVLDRAKTWVKNSVKRERFEKFVVRTMEKLEDSSEFAGHQSRLSNYFRNLYSAFVFLQESGLSKDEQYVLAKVLRAKLSNYEQALLALNMLSRQGEAWMRGSLMAVFQPIKNIPRSFFQFDQEFDAEQLFPMVTFEWREEQNLGTRPAGFQSRTRSS
jgi:hypothetical protein